MHNIERQSNHSCFACPIEVKRDCTSFLLMRRRVGVSGEIGYVAAFDEPIWSREGGKSGGRMGESEKVGDDGESGRRWG